MIQNDSQNDKKIFWEKKSRIDFAFWNTKVSEPPPLQTTCFARQKVAIALQDKKLQPDVIFLGSSMEDNSALLEKIIVWYFYRNPKWTYCINLQ